LQRKKKKMANTIKVASVSLFSNLLWCRLAHNRSRSSTGGRRDIVEILERSPVGKPKGRQIIKYSENFKGSVFFSNKFVGGLSKISRSTCLLIRTPRYTPITFRHMLMGPNFVSFSSGERLPNFLPGSPRLLPNSRRMTVTFSQNCADYLYHP
jgi:hypothetical protein